MRVLVSGGCGFIGSHFIRQWFTGNAGGSLINVDSLTYAGSDARLEDLASDSRYRFVRADICDGKAMRDLLAEVEGVVHFAAETHVDRSITDAAPFLRTNVEGTYTLLQCAQQAGVKRFIHISTDEVYGPVLSGSVKETAPMAPRSPYAASKAAGDLLAQSFHETYGFPVVVIRPTNIYGPWQYPEKFMPLCAICALERQPIPIYGDGQQRRGWLFVRDACEAIRCIMEKGEAGQVYNVGSGQEQANWDTARAILAEAGAPESLLTHVTDRPGHDRRYAMDDSKVRQLGWKPQVSFSQGLSETVSWYRAHTGWWRPLMKRLREDPYHWLNRASGSSAVSPARS